MEMVKNMQYIIIDKANSPFLNGEKIMEVDGDIYSIDRMRWFYGLYKNKPIDDVKFELDIDWATKRREDLLKEFADLNNCVAEHYGNQ